MKRCDLDSRIYHWGHARGRGPARRSPRRSSQAEAPLRPMSGDILLTKKGLPMLPEQAEEELAAARAAERPKQEQQEQEAADEDDEC